MQFYTKTILCVHVYTIKTEVRLFWAASTVHTRICKYDLYEAKQVLYFAQPFMLC
jgi:hypothetical protein